MHIYPNSKYLATNPILVIRTKNVKNDRLKKITG